MSTPMGLIMHPSDKQIGIGDVASEIQTALKNQCVNFNVALLSLTNEHQAELNKISGDPNLSDTGKMTKRAGLLDLFLVKIDLVAEEARAWTVRAETIRQQIVRDEVGLMPSASDPAVEARAREIRGLFRSIDPAERVRLYNDAMNSNDFETMAAVERAPKAFPLLESDILSRLVEDRRRRSHPTQCSDAQSLDAAAVWLTSACTVAKQRLSR